MLAISKSNSIEVLISKALIDSVISHDEFALMKNVLKEYIKMKEEIKSLKTQSLSCYCFKCRKKCRKGRSKNYKDKKRKNKTFIKMGSVLQ